MSCLNGFVQQRRKGWGNGNECLKLVFLIQVYTKSRTSLVTKTSDRENTK